MPLIEAFVPRAALCPGFLMTLSALLKSMTTCTREKNLRMIMYSLDSTDHSETWLVIRSILIRKKLLMTLFVAQNSSKNLWPAVSVATGKTYTLIMYPLIQLVIHGKITSLTLVVNNTSATRKGLSSVHTLSYLCIYSVFETKASSC